MNQNKKTGRSRLSPRQTGPERRNTNPDYVNINTLESETDDVFYVNIGVKKNKEKDKVKGAFQFEKYDDKEAINYYDIGEVLPRQGTDGDRSPYINHSHHNNSHGYYENVDNGTISPIKSKLNYVELNLPKSRTNSRMSSSGSSVVSSPVPSPSATTTNYVSLDYNATGAINRSISEHRQQEAKHKSKGASM